MVQRVSFRRRHSYNTKSNKVKIIRTPGNRLIIQYRKKLGSIPKCSDCKIQLHGIKSSRPATRTRMRKSELTVKRPYGGVVCHKCVKDKIMQAFLTEEQNIVEAVIRQQTEKKPKAE